MDGWSDGAATPPLPLECNCYDHPCESYFPSRVCGMLAPRLRVSEHGPLRRALYEYVVYVYILHIVYL